MVGVAGDAGGRSTRDASDGSAWKFAKETPRRTEAITDARLLPRLSWVEAHSTPTQFIAAPVVDPPDRVVVRALEWADSDDPMWVCGPAVLRSESVRLRKRPVATSIRGNGSTKASEVDQ